MHWILIFWFSSPSGAYTPAPWLVDYPTREACLKDGDELYNLRTNIVKPAFYICEQGSWVEGPVAK